MRYFLTLLLIALVSTSEIIDKTQEISLFGEDKDVELQFLGFIPIIGKIVTAAVGLFTKAKAFIAGTKIFHAIKTAAGVVGKVIGKGKALIMKGKALIQNSKIFQTGKKIFDTGRQIYDKYKGLIQNSKLYQRVTNTVNNVRNAVEKSKIYQTYKKVKETYDKGKEVYDQVKSYYEKGKDFYQKYLQPQNQQNQQPQQQQQQQQQQRQQQQLSEKQKAFIKYGQLRNNKSMTYEQKKVEINKQLDYMFSKGFITPTEKQGMSKF